MKNQKGKRGYRKYDTAFKARALEKLSNGESAVEVAHQLGISPGLLYHWKKTARSIFSSQTEPSEEALSAQLRAKEKEIKELKKDIEVLKKALLLFSQID